MNAANHKPNTINTMDEYIYFTGGPEADKLYGPKRETDELNLPYSDAWIKASMHNLGFGALCKYRRKITPQNQWISVKDRLPRNGKIVIVDGGIAQYTRGAGWMTMTGYDSGSMIQWEVTHWQELPKLPAAPKEDESEKAFKEWLRGPTTPYVDKPEELAKKAWYAAIKYANRDNEYARKEKES